ALCTLALHPFTASIGASGAVAGLAGGAITIYGPRVRSLSWRMRAKLGILILFAAGLVATEFARGGLYLAHTTGLLGGMVLASFLVYVAKTTRGMYWTFIGLVPLLVIAAVLVQRYHRTETRGPGGAFSVPLSLSKPGIQQGYASCLAD